MPEDEADDFIDWAVCPFIGLVAVSLVVELKILLVLLEVCDSLIRLAGVQHLVQQSELRALEILGTVP